MELTITINYNPAEKSAVKFLKDVISLNTFKKNIILKTTSNPVRTYPIEKIKKVVCEFYKIKPEKIDIKCRKREIVIPRQIIHYLARLFTTLSTNQISKKVGNLTHATIINSVTSIQNLIDTDKTFRNQIEEIKKLLK